MARLIVLFLVLSGCAIDGVYTGDCTLESGNSKNVYELEIDIDQEGEDIGGDVLVLHSGTGFGYYAEGEIEGSKDGDDVVMTFKWEAGAPQITGDNMVLDGTIDGRDISGGCERGSIFGSFTVTRQ